MTPLVFDTSAIKRATTPELVFAAVRDALIAHAHGRTIVPPPLHLPFPHTDGDCHVKAGWITDTPDFTVKIATGFYRNPDAGLPTNHGPRTTASPTRAGEDLSRDGQPSAPSGSSTVSAKPVGWGLVAVLAGGRGGRTRSLAGLRAANGPLHQSLKTDDRQRHRGRGAADG